MVRKVIAATDITYPNKEGKAVVMWKAGDEVDDANVAELFVTYAKELVRVVAEKDVEAVKVAVKSKKVKGKK